MAPRPPADTTTPLLLVIGLIVMFVVGGLLVYYMTRPPAYSLPAPVEEAPRPPETQHVTPVPATQPVPDTSARAPIGGLVPETPAPPPPAVPAPEPAQPHEPSPPPPGEWISIFDGKDLSSWRHSGNARIEDGAIVSENGEDIYYDAAWGGLILDAEMLLETGPNPGVALGVVSIAHDGMGRGGSRVFARFHVDGDCHITSHSKVYARSGPGHFPPGRWLPVRFEMTRSRFRVFRDGNPVVSADVSDLPLKKGGVMFYSVGSARVSLRNLRVRVISH